MISLDENRPPLPPADLMLRVIPPFGDGDAEVLGEAFDATGLNNLLMFERALGTVPPWQFGDELELTDLTHEGVGTARSFADFDRLLDFGCGCGRFLRHLGSLADHLEIHGTDIDAEMIEWLRANVPFGRYEVAPHEPPLPYPDHHFDLIINHSVFTHLDERYQDLWLSELQRITRPGGLVLATVEGQSTWARTKSAVERAGGNADPWQEELETRGILFIRNDSWIGSTHPDFYHSAIHAPWYVFEHWSAVFDVFAYLPDGAWSQDLVILRRRPDGAPPSPRAIGRRFAPSRPANGAVATPELGRPTVRRANELVTKMFGRLRLAAPRSGTTVPGAESSGPDSAELLREVAMLRAGLYEQGRRISVLGEQLRGEIRATRERDTRD